MNEAVKTLFAFLTRCELGPGNVDGWLVSYPRVGYRNLALPSGRSLESRGVHQDRMAWHHRSCRASSTTGPGSPALPASKVTVKLGRCWLPGPSQYHGGAGQAGASIARQLVVMLPVSLLRGTRSPRRSRPIPWPQPWWLQLLVYLA